MRQQSAEMVAIQKKSKSVMLLCTIYFVASVIEIAKDTAQI